LDVAKRIGFGYLGGLLLPLILLPVAAYNTMGGHSLMYLGIYASPVGMLAAIAYSDVKRRFQLIATLVRTLSTCIVLFAVLLVLAQLEDYSPFFKNDSWMLIPILGPMLACGATEFILGKRRIA